ALVFGWASAAQARVVRQSEAANLTEGSVGVGLQLGCPTGVSLQMRLSMVNSGQAEAGFGCGQDILLTGDYLLEMGNFLVDPHTLQVSWYIGLGGRYSAWYGGPVG